MADLAVVIPTRNGGPLFREVLEALARQQFAGTTETIVIDSGSTDGTVELARSFKCRVLPIDPATFNHGATRDQAIAATDAPVVVLLTQDAVPADQHLLARLHGCFADPKVAGAYGRQIPRAGADVLTCRNVNNHLTGRRQEAVQEVPDTAELAALHPLERYVRCNFDNVCSAVRRSAWENNRFGHCDFGEDLSWSSRVLAQGWKIIYQPAAAVVHSHDRSLRYEYDRTYMCHRTLYELFGVRTIPTRRHVARSLCVAVLQDARFVIQNERRLAERIRLLAKIPAMAVASVLGQFRGARDQHLARGRKRPGV